MTAKVHYLNKAQEKIDGWKERSTLALIISSLNRAITYTEDLPISQENTEITHRLKVDLKMIQAKLNGRK
jgi:hypothetical protein